jgi:Dolichyl-phosphate-mannose-protein mannosyltransferase
MLPARSDATAIQFATAVEVSTVEPATLDSVELASPGVVRNESSAPHNSYLWLLALFVVSLALVNPWVRGDGVGYYAFARALLIQHNLDFTPDYNAANASFRGARLDENGIPKPIFRTATKHLENHFTVGPAILWAPFLIVAHAGVLLARALGASVTADGFSTPYRFAMALGTAVYGFLGLLLAMRIAAKYVGQRWAFLATVAIWWASSLPVYMYFNPSWSHAHSAFMVALFLWYWHETRDARSTGQWVVLAAIVGLMLNVYYPNALVLVVLAVEAVPQYLAAFHRDQSHVRERFDREPIAHEVQRSIPRLAVNHLLFAVVTIACLLPTFVSRYVIYGNPFESGYFSLRDWAWRSPYFVAVLFSSEHGLFAWTPVIALACIGVVIFALREPRVGGAISAAMLAFYFFIACYPDWAGISSYGNRFFVSLTPIFVIGLSVFFDRASRFFASQRTSMAAFGAAVALLVVWNLAFIFQWGTHLVPARGPIVWSEMIHNQFAVVPREIATKAQGYLFHRSNLMQQIEERDIEQMHEK